MSESTGPEGGTAGVLVLDQPKKGYRYSIDPFLLAHFALLKPRDRIIDLGSGVGVIGILLAFRRHDIEVVGIEIQPRLLRFAEKNREQNEVGRRVENILGDYRRILDYFPRSSFTAAVANPPYHPVGNGRNNADDECTVARHEIAGGMADVVAAATNVLVPGGRLFLVYSAKRTVDLFGILRSCDFEPKRIRFVHARRESPARMVLVEARKGSGVELSVMPPLFIWEATGVYTEEAEEILAGSRGK